MLKILRKNNKKILAVVGVFLMIAFIIPSVAKRPGRNTQTEVVGQIGDEKIYANAYSQARLEWEALTQRVTVPRAGARASDEFSRSSVLEEMLAIKLYFTARAQAQQQFGAMGMSQFIEQLTSRIASELAMRQIRQMDATTYLLLLREAQRMDVHVSRDMVQSWLSNRLNVLPTNDPELRELAVTHWLTIQEAFDRLASAAKMSPADATQMIARGQEKISLAMVEFKAEKYKAAVKEPTKQQLEEFFQKYRNENAEASESAYGYRYPNRVRIQYVRIPRDKVKQTVTVEDVYRQYKRHPELYQTDPTTMPAATRPTTREALGPATRQATRLATTTVASTQPTTRPFADVKNQIVEALSHEMAQALAKTVLQSLSTDWPTYRQAAHAAGTTHPANAPGTDAPYDSYVYLLRLRERIEKNKESRGVMPETTEEGTVLSAKELADLPGIGKASEGGISFPRYAIETAERFLTESQRKQYQENRVQTLALYQPSPIFSDADGNLYVFRIIEADPAHAPAKLAEVESKVKEDYIANEAFQKAKEVASKFLETAKSKGGLQQALNAAGGDAKLIETDVFTVGQRTLEKFKLPSDVATGKFTTDAFNLLYERIRTGKEHPLGTIESPKGGVVLVAQIENAEPTPLDDGFTRQVAQIQRYSEGLRQSEMLMRWLNADEVAARMHYVSDRKSGKRPVEEPPAEEPPPLF
jgi:hypothetical protein